MSMSPDGTWTTQIRWTGSVRRSFRSSPVNATREPSGDATGSSAPEILPKEGSYRLP
jgi:hypothetical protein